jgi:Hydrazine synthase alpha subunit middle domain
MVDLSSEWLGLTKKAQHCFFVWARWPVLSAVRPRASGGRCTDRKAERRLDSLMKLSWRILLAVTSFILGLVLGAIKPPLAASGPAGGAAFPEIIFVQAPVVVAGELAQRFPQGSRLVRLGPGKPAPTEVLLTPDFFAAADAQISWDGSRVLFSGRENASARWQIWEMKTDGSHRHQVTHCSGDCIRPAFLPRNQIVYGAYDGKSSRETSALFVSQENGDDAHRITFGPGNFQVETVLRDGRILISAGSPLVASDRRSDSRALYTIRIDGTGLALFRGNSRSNVTRTEADEMDDRAVLFVERNRTASQQSGGALAWIRPGETHNSLVTPRQSVYWSAHKLQGETLVVAKANTDSPGAAGKFDLYAFNLASRKLGKLIYSHPRFSSVQAVPVEPRPAARHYWSILHPQAKTGRVICLNSYLSADAPRGRLAAPIARVRVMALDPDYRSERVLGEAAVEKDGSFYIQVPADRPIRFELLGSSGRLIHAQRSWVWARNGEDMGCAGCHDDKAVAPPNHWPLALNRLDTPIALGEARPSQTTGH